MSSSANRTRVIRVTAVLAATGGCLGLLPTVAAAAAPRAAHAASHHAVVGDFDGDGKPDLAAGAPGVNRVRVTYTSAKPGGSHVEQLRPDAHSNVYSMHFGTALAMGDFDGDGYSDLAVGAPDFTTPPTGIGVRETRGAVFVFLGSAHGLHAQPLQIEGPYDGDEPYNLGGALAATDIDGDGYADLAATLAGGDSGDIKLYAGSPSGLGSTPAEELNDFDTDTLAFGDVNGDGHPDLVAGTTTDLHNPHDESFGNVLVFTGRSSGALRHRGQKVRADQVGATKYGQFGAHVATGDVNGDGTADVVVSAPTDHKGGAVVLLTGSHHGLKPAHAQLVRERVANPNWHDGDEFGASVDIAKVDGDRFGEVIVGAPHDSVGGTKNAGALYLLHGSQHGIATADAQRMTQATAGIPGGAAKNAFLGAAVHGVRLHGDGFADVVVGAPGHRGHSTHSGEYLIIHGAHNGLDPHSADLVRGTTANGRLGASVV